MSLGDLFDSGGQKDVNIDRPSGGLLLPSAEVGNSREQGVTASPCSQSHAELGAPATEDKGRRPRACAGQRGPGRR